MLNGLIQKKSKNSLREARQASLSRGFTLIEILLVVIIIGVLVSLVAPRLAGRSQEARIQAAHADIDGGIALAIDLYEVDNGTYPDKLEDLIKQPGGVASWRGPYLKKVIVNDPWGKPYVYRMPGQRNASSYDLYSGGPDKTEGTEDDVSNWDSKSPY